MKYKINIMAVFIISLIFINGCHLNSSKMNFVYHAKIATGEYLTLDFDIYFKSSQDLEVAMKRKDNLTHALNLIFPAYPYSRIDEGRLPTLLEKACNQVFYKSVKKVKIKSVEFKD